jgi:hypothetical protein
LAVSLVLLALLCPSLWAGGKKQIETVTAEGEEIWQHDYNIRSRRKGQYNYIVRVRDRGGNEGVVGPVNLKINPVSGLSEARIVYPANNAIIRESLDILGLAAGNYGVGRVMLRLDNLDWREVSGTEYWSRMFDFTGVEDGKHSFSVQAFDSRDVPGPIQKINFTLDTTAPAINMTSHKVGDVVGGNVSFRGTVSDPNGITSAEYSTDGVNFKSLPGRKRGAATLDFSISMATKKVADGPLVIYLRALDTTGISTEFPCLFFVDNRGPVLDVYSPAQGEDVYGTFVLSGYAYDSIGIENLYYEWGKVRESIPLRPGDPYWAVPLDMVKGSANAIKLTAVDKVGNTSTATVRLEDRRKAKVPTLVIEYPTTTAELNSLPVDASIYGYIDAEVEGHAVIVEGIGEVEARSSFRIGPEMIPMGRGNLRLTPVAFDGTRGSTVSIRYTKLAVSRQADSSITVATPGKYSWLYGTSFILNGRVSPPDSRLEYRLTPHENWRAIYTDTGGVFNEEISLTDRPHGPVHLELRTGSSGATNASVYHPFNRAVTRPEVRFLSPPKERGMVYGNKTVIGTIDNAVPIRGVAYSLDRVNFQDIPFTYRYGKAWFTYICDFDALHVEDGQLFFRIIDAGDAVVEAQPFYEINPSPPLPTLIVSTPGDDVVITSPFEISGVAFDDVGISSIYWRILGPKRGSVSSGPAGEWARELAFAYEQNPNVPFRRLMTDQSFVIPVDFSMIADGEYVLEIYASGTYGARSETISRTIKISTQPPDNRIIYPSIDRYNNHAILVKGYASDANGVAEIILSMDNGVTWQDVPLGNDGLWEIPLNTVVYKDGIYSALIYTVDNYGITTFSNAMINIDNTPPELYISSPVNGQHVGTIMPISGRVSDNIQLKNLDFQIISAANPRLRYNVDIPPQLVMLENVDLSIFPQGEYIIRVVATDLADNESIVSRNIIYDADDNAAQVAIFTPQPGESHTGPINVAGIVSGTVLPESVRVLLDGRLLTLTYVDRYGVFKYQIPETMLTEETAYRLSVSYDSKTNRTITSPIQTVYYNPFGTALLIDSHHDGDVITDRPWLSGRAWFKAPPPEDRRKGYSRKDLAAMKVSYIEVSFDNGRSFRKAKGKDKWKYRLETSLLPAGPQPVLVRAKFANGDEALRRILLTVDTTAPQVDAVAPIENTVHRNNMLVFGTASDNYALDNVAVSLRPHSKFWYSVPGPLQGLYFDVKAFGATDFDVGLGISLFDNAVRLQGQFGIAPADGVSNLFQSGGRFTGYVAGVKLLANVFYLPLRYLFGPDWGFYSINFAVGANFSWFSMSEWEGSLPRDPLYMGAIVAQLDIANIDMQFFYPKWKYFRRFALYLEPEVWFASTDVEDADKVLFRMTVGLRLNWF